MYGRVHFIREKRRILPPMPPEPDHVPLRRIWDFKSGQLKLDFVEYLHVIDCEKCRASFRACIQSSTFEEAQALTGPTN